MTKCVSLTACVGWIVIIGCSQERPTTTAPPTSNPALAVDGSKYLLSNEPDDGMNVIKAREATKDGDQVVIVGRIGGGKSPWIEGRAAFFIVDCSLNACSDIPGDKCDQPWDYCCETHKLPTSTALVKVVDENGDLMKADARELLKVKELSTVVVTGKSQRDDAGNLTILASGVYVKRCEL